MSATPIPCLLQSYGEVATRLEKLTAKPTHCQANPLPSQPRRCGMRHRTRACPSSAISLPKSATPGLDAQTRNPYSRWRLWIPGFARSSRAPNDGSTSLRARSALDISRPGLLDQLDHRIRHRNVVEFLGHLVALGESPFEELDGLGGRRLVDRLLVHQDEGRPGNRP